MASGISPTSGSTGITDVTVQGNVDANIGCAYATDGTSAGYNGWTAPYPNNITYPNVDLADYFTLEDGNYYFVFLGGGVTECPANKAAAEGHGNYSSTATYTLSGYVPPSEPPITLFGSSTVASTTLQGVGATAMGFAILITIFSVYLCAYMYNQFFKKRPWRPF